MKKRYYSYKKILLLTITGSLIIIFSISFYYASYYNLFDHTYYSDKDFNLTYDKSLIDYDQDGIEDYKDIMLGARAAESNKPKYKSFYYVGGYPPNTEGVCTDTLWRALQVAGYNIKDLLDKDIKNNPKLYYDTPDPNIDFRRVKNLEVFFERHLIVLSTNPYELEAWQGGDIVIFNHSEHIGIISDKRNKDGIPFIIHNSGQPIREENALLRNKNYQITGHYRFKLHD